ncbi:hypothetical protein N7533_001474 [Penicillium manginii]|jgi:hypothetical protein|uniref:uncharacterized protein n=1 Tax=Penicillium manginii TaxID=203109 RepID=UPI002546E4A7|nr:uncharacterized protein N7533_001474 [Penicillium manginii]KAJ5762793.1 hypothetical protein N7533_001474 [Penicillium manginii]
MVSIVFAFQNAERARYLNPRITYRFWNLDNETNSHTLFHDLSWTNCTEQDTFYAYHYYGYFKEERRLRVRWSLSWQSCDEDAFENHPLSANMINNSSSWSTWFTLQDSAPKVDLIAATANKTCPEEYGMANNLTDKTMEVPMGVRWSGGDYTNSTCAVVALSTPTPTPDPCRVHIDRVHIDKTIVASTEASLKSDLCKGIDRPSDCPEGKDNAAHQLAVAGISCLLAAVGALGFFLV